MKLWKILLAAMVAVLMISTVAMADHEHQWSNGYDVQIGEMYSGNDGHHYAACVTVQHCAGCNETKQSAQFVKKVGDCEYGPKKTVDPTCAVPGYSYEVCKVCSYEKKGPETPATGNHVWRQIAYYPATCMQPNIVHRECLECGKFDDWINGDPNYRKDCEKTVKVWLSKPTCQADGKYAMACKWCGNYEAGRGEVTVPKGPEYHDWNKTTVPATCTTLGIELKDCKICGAHAEDTVSPALGHHPDYSKQVIVPATCTTGGYTTAPCHRCGETVTYGKTSAAHTAYSEKGYVNATCSTPGHQAYAICTACNTIWDHTGEVISAIPVIPANGKHILPQTGNTVYRPDCTATNNYIEGTCEVCGKTYVREYLPAAQHVFPTAAELVKANPPQLGGANCTETGWVNAQCKNCQKTQTQGTLIPALGHSWGNWYYGEPADCTTDMVADRYCTRCNPGMSQNHAGYEVKVIEEALGHNWILEAGKDATCTEEGKGTRVCTRCKGKQNNVTIPAKGHDYSKTIEVVKPTCETQGYTVFGCVRCDATQKGNYTAALGHNYQWEVVVKPSEAGNGKNEYTCQVCDKVADTKTVKYTKYYYNNTMTSFGPTTKELVGGNDWYRVTPVDLTVDGVYTYDLIASNKYVVGTVTIAVNAGTMSVSYSVKGNVDVKDEALLIYASKADLAAGSAVTAPVGAAINVAETFGADTKVLVSLILTGDYDAAGKALVDEAAASAMIANID